MRVLLMDPARDVEFAPELRDAVLEAMRGSHSMNPFAVEKARRDQEDERAARRGPPTLLEELTADLGLDAVWRRMADGDPFLYEAARRCMLSSVADAGVILYRQEALADCLRLPDLAWELYGLALDALENEQESGWLWRGAGVGPVLHRSVEVLGRQLGVLRELRALALGHRDDVRSPAFRRFFAMVAAELDEEYLARVGAHIDELRFARGLLQSVALGPGLKGRDHVVRRQAPAGWADRLPFRHRGRGSFHVAPRDEAGTRALEELRARGLGRVAHAVAESAEHVRRFFTTLRIELAFYLGCVNLHQELTGRGEPVCMPVPAPGDGSSVVAEGLYDVSLGLHVDRPLVGNDVGADGRSLVVITGANQGGKSTLLRAIGQAQLMMQCGMFVGARRFDARVREQIHTHFAREEDAGMRGGKLDEELRRMSRIARCITPASLLLCNEFFASTNEREGSEIARQVVRAMLERGITVVVVTHMYDLAHGFWAEGRDDALFLRAERTPDGRRTFRLLEGEPLSTSYGADSYRRIFGTDPAAEPLSGAR